MEIVASIGLPAASPQYIVRSNRPAEMVPDDAGTNPSGRARITRSAIRRSFSDGARATEVEQDPSVQATA